MNAGRIQIGNNVGVTANAIIADRQETGTKVTVLFERNINFFELRYGTRSTDYKFGYAELYLGRSAGNQGTFIPAARIRLRDGNTWEVEDFGVYPARVMGLRMRGGKEFWRRFLMANQSRNKKNQPPTGEGKKQSPRKGEPNKLNKRSEVLQAQRDHREENVGTASEEEAARSNASTARKINPARPKAGR
jgi:hypothetical protein